MKTTIRFLIISSFALALAIISACTPTPPAANSNQANRNAPAQSNSNAAQRQTASPTTAQTSQPAGGTVEIKSNPPGATIFLVLMGEDEVGAPQQYGQTPATVRVPPGKYLVNLEASGYRAFQKQINVAQGKSVTINATLKKR